VGAPDGDPTMYSRILCSFGERTLAVKSGELRPRRCVPISKPPATGHRSARPPVVQVEPLSIDLEVEAGESLIEAAWRAGFYWPTVCYGQAQCLACRVLVLDGAENLVEPGREEVEAMRQFSSNQSRVQLENYRLACQLEVLGPAVVEKRGVRRAVPD
jgi:2Fe-2S ferredoxin